MVGLSPKIGDRVKLVSCPIEINNIYPWASASVGELGKVVAVHAISLGSFEVLWDNKKFATFYNYRIEDGHIVIIPDIDEWEDEFIVETP